jgi:hypothetical protein
MWNTFLFIAGVGSGVITYVPNVMASDSGSTESMRIAGIGILASGTMICGGIYGAFSGNAHVLLVGYGLQAIMVLILWGKG